MGEADEVYYPPSVVWGREGFLCWGFWRVWWRCLADRWLGNGRRMGEGGRGGVKGWVFLVFVFLFFLFQCLLFRNTRMTMMRYSILVFVLVLVLGFIFFIVIFSFIYSLA